MFLLLVLLLLLFSSSNSSSSCNVMKDYSAIGDNKTDDTENIQRAMDECDVVKFSTGHVFRITKSLVMSSNTTLVVEKNTSIFSDQELCDPHVSNSCIQDPKCPTLYWPQGPTSIFCGKNLTNVAIVGQDARTSIIDGGGWNWFVVLLSLSLHIHTHIYIYIQVQSWIEKYIYVGYGTSNL